MKRSVFCLAKTQAVNDSFCDLLTRPPVDQECNKQACDGKERRPCKFKVKVIITTITMVDSRLLESITKFNFVRCCLYICQTMS